MTTNEIRIIEKEKDIWDLIHEVADIQSGHTEDPVLYVKTYNHYDKIIREKPHALTTREKYFIIEWYK
jgi:hypothetical protein